MDSQRNFIIIALLFVSFIIWQMWEKEKNSQSQQIATQTTVTSTNNIINQNNELSFNTYQGKKIKVKTDVLELTINTYGGNVEQALLLAYPKKLNSNEPFQLLSTTPEFTYQAQSGLFKYNGLNGVVDNMCPLYNVDRDVFILNDNQNELTISMNWTDIAGNVFIKTFTVKRGEYIIDVSYNIQNVENKPLIVSNFAQLKQSIRLPSQYNSTNNNGLTLHTFRGAAYSTSNDKYKKYKFDTIIANKNLNIYTKGGWIAMLQQYFVTAWIPCNNSINNFYTINLGNDMVVIGYKSQSVLIQPGQSNKLQSKLWIGPEIQDKMAAIAPYLDLTVDYGWLWFISQPLFKLLKFIYSFLGNWGYAIVSITFIVRSIMYPLTKKQLTSMAKIRMLQPKIQAMRERLSDNKQLQNKEIVSLYKSEKINPFGGCFPLLIQMPIFLALYYMLIGSVELRHAPFILWIHDLSAQDPYYILPILMGLTMFFIQKMSSTNITNQTQQKVMIIIPIIFTTFFLWFPSGLVLYYIVSNLVTIIQQQLIYRSLERCGLYKHKKPYK